MILASQSRFPCELAAFLGRELRHAYLAASAAMWLSLIVEAMATCFRRAWRRRRLHQQVFDPAVIADDLPCLVAAAGGQCGDGASRRLENGRRLRPSPTASILASPRRGRRSWRPCSKRAVPAKANRPFSYPITPALSARREGPASGGSPSGSEGDRPWCYTKAMNHRLLMELLRNGLTSVVVILAILAVAVILVHVLP